MRHQISTCISLALMVFTLSAQAADYREGWESRKTSSSSLKQHAGCYTRSKHGYDSFSFSSKYKTEGRYSLRVELHGDDKNSPCKQKWARSEKKSRSEVRLAYNQDAFNKIRHGDTIEFSFDLYIPSNEGTNRNWLKGGRQIFISQLMGWGNSDTPEVGLLLGKGNRLTVESRSSTVSKGEKLKLKRSATSISTGKWYEVKIQWKRTYKSDGYLKVYLNGKLFTNIKGPVAIRNKPYAYGKVGAYFGTEKLKEKYVLYFDDIRMSSRTSSSKTLSEDSPLPPSSFKGW